MKILKDIILNCNRKKAIQFATNNHEKSKRKNAKIGYEYVFNILLKKRKRKSDFKIELSYVKNNYFEIDDFEPYYDIHGINNKNESLALEFTPWSQWLGSELIWDDDIDKIIKEQGIEFAIGQCLWEMTFLGFEEKIIKNKLKRMDREIKKIKEGKAKLVKFDSIDILIQEIDK